MTAAEDVLGAILELSDLMEDSSKEGKETILKTLAKHFGFEIELRHVR